MFVTSQCNVQIGRTMDNMVTAQNRIIENKMLQERFNWRLSSELTPHYDYHYNNKL